MKDVNIEYCNDVHMRLDCNAGILYEISDYFSFYVPGYQFMPKFKHKIWDGKIRLVSNSGLMYVGLLPYLMSCLKRWGYTVELSEALLDRFKYDHTDEYIESFLRGLNPHSGGNQIEHRSHQISAIKKCIKTGRNTILSPTSSGKSLIIYSLTRFYQEHHPGKILIIVPTTSLVEQMYDDFADYSSEDKGWNAEDECHMIYSGKGKQTDKGIVITTWQSIYKMPKSWFKQYSVALNDEVHLAKAKSLSGIMEKMTKCPFKFGFTGTLDGTEVNKLVITGLFGPVSQFVTTSDLMDAGVVAQLQIKCLTLKYDEMECKKSRALKYPDEIKYISRHARRNNVIANLAAKQDKNQLILFTKIEHGEEIVERIREKIKGQEGRHVYLLHGGNSVTEREEIRKLAEKKDGLIIVASYGIFSTGVSIKNIHSVVFASPTKSQIRTLQSLGRGLRMSETKTDVVLYDIVDDLAVGKHKNYALKHFVERLKIYNKEKFDYSLHRIDL